MKKNDQVLLEEVYNTILKNRGQTGNDILNEAKKKKTNSEVKDETPDSKTDDTNDYLANRRKKRQEAINGKKKDKKGLEEAYQQILESKHINKKFAKRYNRVTAGMLKADPGSKEYIKLKNERDDLVNILKDHGMTPSDLDGLLTKQEKEEVRDEVEADDNKTKEENNCNICGGDHNKNNCREVGGLP